jgi:hypothetical protein
MPKKRRMKKDEEKGTRLLTDFVVKRQPIKLTKKDDYLKIVLKKKETDQASSISST